MIIAASGSDPLFVIMSQQRSPLSRERTAKRLIIMKSFAAHSFISVPLSPGSARRNPRSTIRQKPKDIIAEQVSAKVLSVKTGPLTRMGDRFCCEDFVPGPLPATLEIAKRFWQAYRAQVRRSLDSQGDQRITAILS